MRTFAVQTFADDISFLTAQERAESVWRCFSCWDDFVGNPSISIKRGDVTKHYCEVCALQFEGDSCECCD